MQTSPLISNNLHAFLFLPSSPSNGETLDWHWRRIAGVPFLLRNIVTIQRAGIKNIIIFIDATDKILDEIRERLNHDQRVEFSQLSFSNTQGLVEILKRTKELLFLDGSVLHDKVNISSLITKKTFSNGSAEYPSYVIKKAELNSIFERSDNFSFPKLKNSLEQSCESLGHAFDTEKQLRIFLPEITETKISKAGDFKTTGEHIIKTTGGLRNDSFITQILSRPISSRLTRLFLNTPFTPNQITFLSFILGMGSAWCFFQGGYQMGVSGAGLLLLSIWVDGVDGEIARIKFLETTLGGKLDIYCDNIVHIAVFLSIGIGLFQISDQVIFLYLGLLAGLGSFVSFLLLHKMIIKEKSKANSLTESDKNKTSLVDKLTNRDFTHFLFLLALINQLDVFLWMTAIGVNLLVIFILFRGRLT